MFSPKQLNPFCTLVLILTAFCLSNCSDKSEYGEASDYEKLGYGPSGSGIIKGTVLDNGSDALSGVSVTFAKSGTTSSVVTTVDNGTYSKTSLSSGTYTLTYSKSGYLETTQSATLATDREELTVATVKQLPDTCASTGTISGTIKDAVSASAVSDVILSVRSGLNETSGTIVKTENTSNSGTYSFSSMNAGWYTVQTSKSGYIAANFNVFSCGNVSSQDHSISTSLSSGTMRIVLSWPANSTSTDLDSHLTGPDNLSGQGHSGASTKRFHVKYPSSGQGAFYYAANNYSCTCDKSDNVTVDQDDQNAPGTETITISNVRSGTYRYSVHEYHGISSGTTLAKSGASVTVYYNDLSKNPTTYNVSNASGNLWSVFTFDTSVGLTETNNLQPWEIDSL
jgi:hypothetical protein